MPVELDAEQDYYRRQNEFRVWLKLARQTAFEVMNAPCCLPGSRCDLGLGVYSRHTHTLSTHTCHSFPSTHNPAQSLTREKAQALFEKFVGRWNKGQLEDMYYGQSIFAFWEYVDWIG